MAQQNPFDQFDTAPAQATGPVYGAPPKPEKPNEPKTTYRPLSPEEIKQRGLPAGNYQVSSEGNVSKVGGDVGGTVDEKRVATLTARIAGAFSDINSVNKEDPSAQEPGVIESLRGGLSPTGVMGIPTRLIAGANRRTVYDAQVDALDALLTLGTGAAYNREQLEGQLASYFPAYGDTQQEIATKNQRLQRQIEAAKANAGPAWANVEPLIAQYLQGVPGIADQGGEDPGITGTVTDDRPNEDPNAIQVTRGGPGVSPNYDGGFWPGIGAGVGDIVEGLANNTVGLVSNPVSSALGRAMGYDGYTADLGQTLRDALQLPEGNQTASSVIQAASGGFGGAGMARGLGGLVGSNALAQYGANPLLDTLTGASAAASGEAARQMGAGPGGQALATLAGGFVPAGLVGARNAVRGGRPPSGPAPDMNVVRAGERQNIPVRAPDAQPNLRGEYAALESGEKSGPMISRARVSDAEAIDARAVEVAGGSPYKPDESTAMGQRIQANARAAEKGVKDRAGSFYTRVQQEAPGFVTPASRTATFIDAKIAELQARSPSGYADEVNALKAMKSDLEKTGLSVETLQAQRETVGGRIGDNVQARTRADKTFTEVLDAAAGELHDAMKAANPKAAAILMRADAKWGQYKRLQKEVTGLFLGKRDDMTPEAAARALNATAKNNYEALRKFMTVASEQDKADFAATFARNWGSDQRGNFSPAAFAKSMEKVGDRTLDALVGTEGRKALRDLQVLSNAKTDAMSRMAPSGKAMSAAKAGLRTAVLSALGLSQGGFVGAVVLPVAGKLIANMGEERAARLLLNPDFTKWLRAMPEATNPKAINAYFGKLKAAGAKSQVVANDIDGFTNAVLESFSQSPGRAAAQDENN